MPVTRWPIALLAPTLASCRPSPTASPGPTSATPLAAPDGAANGSASASGGGPIRQIAASTRALCVLLDDGAVTCSGYLMRPKADRRPVRMDELPSLRQIASHDAMWCGLAAEGDVHCWGRPVRGPRDFGMYGGDTEIKRAKPASRLWGGGETHCAESRADGGLECWTAENRVPWPINIRGPILDVGILGDDLGDLACGQSERGIRCIRTSTVSDEPQQEPPLFGAGAVAMAVWDRAMCGLLPNGRIECYGPEYSDVLKFAPAWSKRLAFADTRTFALSAGYACVEDTGSVVCAELEKGSARPELADWKAPVSRLRGVRHLEQADWFGCAVTDDARLTCWGGTERGEFGMQSGKAGDAPVDVTEAFALAARERPPVAIRIGP